MPSLSARLLCRESGLPLRYGLRAWALSPRDWVTMHTPTQCVVAERETELASDVAAGRPDRDWKVGVKDVESMRCGGCGAGAFQMLDN